MLVRLFQAFKTELEALNAVSNSYNLFEISFGPLKNCFYP